MRALLLSAAAGDDGSFPRSAAMRLAFNPGAMRVAISVASALLMLRRRRNRRVPGSPLLPRLTHSLGALIGTRQHRP